MENEPRTLFDAAMALRPADTPNVRLAVPFYRVRDIDASLRFYVDGLGFAIARRWEPDGRIAWCWLELGQVAVMLQEGALGERPGEGVTLCLMCADAVAVYHEARARGLVPEPPIVGNGLWVTSFVDPDGYRIDFESPTDLPEETRYADPS